MADGPTWASSLQILVLLFRTVVLIQESIGGDILGSYQATSVSKTFVAPEFVSNSTNHRRFKSRAKRSTSRRVLHTVKGISSFNLERDLLLCGDVAINPGPKGKKSMSKYPCSECHKAVRNNAKTPRRVIAKTPSCVLHVETGHMLNASIFLGLFSSTT